MSKAICTITHNDGTIENVNLRIRNHRDRSEVYCNGYCIITVRHNVDNLWVWGLYSSEDRRTMIKTAIALFFHEI